MSEYGSDTVEALVGQHMILNLLRPYAFYITKSDLLNYYLNNYKINRVQASSKRLILDREDLERLLRIKTYLYRFSCLRQVCSGWKVKCQPLAVYRQHRPADGASKRGF